MSNRKLCSRCRHPIDEDRVYCSSCGRVLWWSVLANSILALGVGAICLLVAINATSQGWILAGILIGLLSVSSLIHTGDTLLRSEIVRARNQNEGENISPATSVRVWAGIVVFLGLSLVVGSFVGTQWYAEKERTKAEAHRREAEQMKDVQSALTDVKGAVADGPSVAAAGIVDELTGRTANDTPEHTVLRKAIRQLSDAKFRLRLTVNMDDRGDLVKRWAQYVEELKTIQNDAVQVCPASFKNAYSAYCQLWGLMLEYVQQVPDAQDSEEEWYLQPEILTELAFFSRQIRKQYINLKKAALEYDLGMDGNRVR